MNTNILRNIVRTILVIISIFWFVFALLSGAEDGLKGILLNIPNTLPWVLLIIFTYITFKRELIGGTLILLSGIFTILMFDTHESTMSFFFISFPLIALGVLLILLNRLVFDKN